MEKFNFILYRDLPRGAVKFAKKYFNSKPIIAIEIGVASGRNSKSILNKLNISRLYLIDSYPIFTDVFTGRKYTEEMQELAKNRSKDFLKGNPNTFFIYKSSDNAINDIKEKADFIYIDGAHNYEQVKKDIENYWKILKNGGIIAGHDIKLFDVAKAVVHFCDKNNLKARNYQDDWYILK